jgi:hypothetical protein
LREADQYLERPVILIGAPCSGTTFLGETLGRHPLLAFADEPRFIWRYGNDHKCDMLSPQDATEEVRQYIRNYFAAFVRDAGAARRLEKSLSNSLRPEFVATVLPDCQFIHILRSPIDAIMSMYSHWVDHAFGTKGIRAGRLKKRMREISLRQLRFYTKEGFFPSGSRTDRPRSGTERLGTADTRPRWAGARSRHPRRLRSAVANVRGNGDSLRPSTAIRSLHGSVTGGLVA